MWIYLGVLSSLFLGLYDVSKKHALRANAVIPVLFFSTACALFWMIAPALFSWLRPEWMRSHGLYVPVLEPALQAAVFLKSAIVSLSWVFAYFAFKHLPITLISPVRASAPVWTLIGAVILFREAPSPLQWIGFFLVIGSYYAFSMIGEREGLRLHRNKWVGFMVLSTIIGTCSTLYDKYLIQNRGLTPMAVQFWFFIWLAVILGAVWAVFWLPVRKRYAPFEWRWSVFTIGAFLFAADFLYFRALARREALIVILSAIRRSDVLVSFTVGSLLFRDRNVRIKSLALLGVLAGMLCMVFSAK
jgi:bacterial/archaeal transporter family protein